MIWFIFLAWYSGLLSRADRDFKVLWLVYYLKIGHDLDSFLQCKVPVYPLYPSVTEAEYFP